MSSYNYDELSKKLESLEKKINSWEESLTSGTHPWGMIDARRVTGSFEAKKNVKLNISELDLVNIYLDIPQIFTNIAIKASLSPDTYRQKTAGIIYLEATGNGNYWIIQIQDDSYWLVPKDNIIINTPVMKTLQSMFDCEGYQERKNQEFILKKPAKLSLNTNNKQWKLEKLGILNFNCSQSQSSFLESEIGQIKEERNKLKLQIQKIEEYIRKNNNNPELLPSQKQFQQLVHEVAEIKNQIATAKNQQQQLEQTQEELQSLRSLLETAEDDRKQMRLQIENLERSRNDYTTPQAQVTTRSITWKNLQEVNILTGHSDSIRTVAVSNWQDRQNIIASGSFDNTIKIWNLETGTLINTLQETSHINAIAIHPHESLLVSGCDDNKIQIWNLDTLTSIPLEVHTNRVLAVAISKDGQTMISGSRDHTLKIWSWTSSNLELRHDITEDYGTILALGITPNNQQIISVYGDNTVRVWDLEIGTLLTTLIRYTDLIWSIAISPDSKTLVCGSRDRTIQIIDLATGNLKQTFTKHKSAVWAVAISPDGNTLASGSSDNTIILWDLHTGEVKNTVTGHAKDILSLSFSADGQKLVSCSRDQKIIIWQPSITQ